MSYILDALRKSQKERNRGKPPGLSESQEYSTPPGKKRSLVTYIVAGLLCLNAAILFIWLAPWEKKEQQTLVQHAPQKTIATGRSETALPAVPLQEPDILGPRNETGLARIEAPAVETSGRTDVRDERTRAAEHAAQIEEPMPLTPAPIPSDSVQEKSEPPVPIQEARPLTSSREQVVPERDISAVQAPVVSPKTSAPERGKLYSLNELPASVQRELPPFTISVSLYSDDPAGRMVKINNQTLHEGETLAEGLILREIRQDGVIFTYKGYRFRIGLN